MDANATAGPRLGIVGLGRNWNRRYRPLLRKRLLGFTIQAAYDASVATARAEADRLGCDVAEGVVELLERADVNAVLLCDAAWHGLWPMEEARRRGKPVLCVPPLSVDGGHADGVLASLNDGGPAVVFERFVASSPAACRLRQLLVEERLGSPQIVTCDVPALDQSQALGVIDWILSLLDPGGEAGVATQRVEASTDASGLLGWRLDLGDGRAAQITVYPEGVSGPRFTARVFTQRGGARIRFPDQLQWRRGRSKGRIDWRGRFDVERATLEEFAAIVVQPADWRTRLRWLDRAWQVYRQLVPAGAA